MKRRCSVVATAVLALTCFTAVAQSEDPITAQNIKSKAPQGISDKFFACIEEADGHSDKHAFSVCISNERRAQDNRLNELYKSTLSKLNSQDKKDLINDQRSWLNFHKQTIEFDTSLFTKEGSYDGFQTSLRETFRLCDRANDMDVYLFFAHEFELNEGEKKEDHN